MHQAAGEGGWLAHQHLLGRKKSCRNTWAALGGSVTC